MGLSLLSAKGKIPILLLSSLHSILQISRFLYLILFYFWPFWFNFSFEGGIKRIRDMEEEMGEGIESFAEVDNKEEGEVMDTPDRSKENHKKAAATPVGKFEV